MILQVQCNKKAPVDSPPEAAPPAIPVLPGPIDPAMFRSLALQRYEGLYGESTMSLDLAVDVTGLIEPDIA